MLRTVRWRTIGIGVLALCVFGAIVAIVLGFGLAYGRWDIAFTITAALLIAVFAVLLGGFFEQSARHEVRGLSRGHLRLSERTLVTLAVLALLGAGCVAAIAIHELYPAGSSPCNLAESEMCRLLVAGTDDIYGAGHARVPAMTAVHGPSNAGGGALPQSVSVVGVDALTIGASGTVVCADEADYATHGPNGPCFNPSGRYTLPTEFDSFNGLSSIGVGSTMFLVGVFSAANAPWTSPTPHGQSFISAAEISHRRLGNVHPRLRQLFYVGDGMRTVGKSAKLVPRIVFPPSGAKHLFLGFADGSHPNNQVCCYDDNGGALRVTVELHR